MSNSEFFGAGISKVVSEDRRVEFLRIQESRVWIPGLRDDIDCIVKAMEKVIREVDVEVLGW
jgi:hypothetical protein